MSSLPNLKSIPKTFCRRSVDSFSYRHTKRTLDFIIALAGLLVMSPVLALTALIIKLDSGGKIFYRQKRCKEKGKCFWIYKFRTMPENAEKKSGPVWPEENDCRCTRTGHFLRSWHIDEFPQLINVLRGEMSLVGPRPERPFFVKKFKKVILDYEFRHRIKPGITGWAQVNGYRGSDTSIKERIQCDLYYIKNWSLLLDFKILLKTFLPPKFFFSAVTFPKTVSALRISRVKLPAGTQS